MNAQPGSANVIEVEQVLGETHHPAFQWMLLVLCGCGLVVGMFAARPLVLTLRGNQPSPTRVSETGPASRAI